MVTLAEEPPSVDKPTPVEKGVRLTRTAIAGHERGAIRRIVLYVIAAAMFGFAPTPANVVGLVALMLLAITDEWV